MKLSIPGLLLLTLTTTFCLTARADQLRVLEQKVGPVPEFLMTLKGGTVHTFETRNLSGEIDPVLHLWDVTNAVEVAMDDNGGGGKSAFLRTRIPRAGNYLLIVRPRNLLSSGTADIFTNGKLLKSNVRVDGLFVFLINLKPTEQIVALSPPAGVATHIQYLLSDDGLHIEKRLRGAPRSRWEVPAGEVGARTVLIGTTSREAGKLLRVYRNDVKLPGADPDKDGLGTGLETQLKTCSKTTDVFDKFACNDIADMRDTDSDGIPDGWEVLGRDFSSTVYVALPTFGSNPRHKDLFVEVDYRRLTREENLDRNERHMLAEVARRIAFAFGDVGTINGDVRLEHAIFVGNPDREPGISVHLDTGLDPEVPGDAAIYGNWGGYDAIDALQVENAFVAQEVEALSKTHMHISRRGIFRYGPGHINAGASCSIGVSFCAYRFSDAETPIHELMHTLGIGHSGPDKIERLGANCKPNYPSIANYAYFDQRIISDGKHRLPINNTRMREFEAVSPSDKEYVFDLQEHFKFFVDPLKGHVDWNRDGVIAPLDETVRAFANNAPGTGCESTRMNQIRFAGIKATSVALTRAGSHTLLFFLDATGTLKFVDSTSAWNCSAADEGCTGSTFGLPVILSFPDPIKTFDAEAVKIDGQDQVSIVGVTDKGLLLERRLLVPLLGPPRLIQVNSEISTAVPVGGEPSLAQTRDGGKMFLVYKGTDNVVRWRFRNDKSWEREQVVVIGANNLVAAADASPGIGSGHLPGDRDRPVIFLAVSDATTRLKLFTLEGSGPWKSTDLQPGVENTPRSMGRPALAWVPSKKGIETPGILYLLFRNRSQIYKTMRTFFNHNRNQVELGLTTPFDNNTVFGSSIDVTTSSTTGFPQLWAAITFEFHKVPFILFRPRADSINDVVQRNYNDWPTAAWGACKFIGRPEDAPSMRCPDRPF